MSDVKIDITYYCANCIIKPRSQDLAIQHSQETKHLVVFIGKIIPKE